MFRVAWENSAFGGNWEGSLDGHSKAPRGSIVVLTEYQRFPFIFRYFSAPLDNHGVEALERRG